MENATPPGEGPGQVPGTPRDPRSETPAPPPYAGGHDRTYGEQPPGPQPGPSGQQATGQRGGFKDLSQLRRSTSNRYVGGVAGGLARHFDIDPVVVRVLLVVLAFFGGASLLGYVALWLLLPEDGSAKDPFGLDDRSRSVAVKVTGVVTGVFAFAAALGDGLGGNVWWLWPTVVVVGLVLFFSERSKHSTKPGYGDPGYPTSPYGHTGYVPAQPAAPGTYGSAPSAPSGPTDVPTSGPAGAPVGGPTGPGSHDPGVEPPTAPFSAVSGDPAAWTPQARAGAESPTQQFAPQTQAYATQAYPTQQYAGQPYPGGPVAQAPYVPVRPRNPRKRGPVLFGFTLALVALAIGVLRVVEMNGAHVVDSAYPALALGVTTLMLLVGSFWGRAGGLIALAMFLALVTGGVTAGERYESDPITVRPTTSAVAAEHQTFDAGEFTLDLTDVADPSGLDGRRIGVDGGIGRLEVVVPEGVAVEVNARVGLGGVTVQDRDLGGIDNTVRDHIGAGPGAPELTLDLDLGVGQVVVRTE